MGINTVFWCERHKVKTVSMRGEEGADLQWWFREHGSCFRDKQVHIGNDTNEYPFDWPDAFEYEDRPDAERKERRSEAIDDARDALRRLILNSR